MKVARFREEYEFPAPVEQVWNLLADTERMNRSLGLPPTQAVVEGDGAVRRVLVKARIGSIPLEWREEPFEFVRPHYHFVDRQFTRGPLSRFTGGIRFSSCEGGSRILVHADLEYSGLAGALAAAAIVRKSGLDWKRIAAGIRRRLDEAGEPQFEEGAGMPSPAQQQRAAAAARSIAPELAADRTGALLIDHLARGHDLEVNRIRPYRLARRWGLPGSEVLATCLRATSSGLTDLSWDVVCPNCRGAPERWRTLESARTRSHCDDCKIQFDVHFDQGVEVTFRPSPAVRDVPDLVYCSGGPGNTPHLLAQSLLRPGEARVWELEIPRGRYRLRNLTASHSLAFYAGDEAPAGTVQWSIGAGGQAEEPDRLHRSGEQKVEVTNAAETEQQVMLEQLSDYEELATAAQVTLMQEFRDLFSSELLAPDARMAIRNLPLLFTDLRGSTAMYRQLGDASAYVLVRDHFRLLRDLVSAHRGGVVKTIGDSVMAAFPTAADAMECALAMMELIGQVRMPDRALQLKLGIHQGSCIAVRSYDDRIDYFGSAVNLAARTHEQSSGEDIIVTAEILFDPALSGLEGRVHIESFETELRGIGPVQLYRLRPRSRWEASNKE